MGKATLVAPDLELGNQVVAYLDDAGFPLYDKAGPQEAYSRAITALSDKIPVSTREIPLTLLENRNPLIRGLRKIFGKAASVKGMRLGGHSIGGVWIDDAYVYRIKK